MRIFVGIFPPPEIQAAAVVGAREAIGSSGDRVRWARSENVHLTLKFLGEVPEEVLGDLCAALEETCARHAPFEAKLAEFGAFPSARRARILWVGVGKGSDRLSSLATDLDAAFTTLGFEGEERPYTPHLTLGRIRGRPESLNLLPDVRDLGFRVQHVGLVESKLTPEGAVYKTVRTFALRASEEFEP